MGYRTFNISADSFKGLRRSQNKDGFIIIEAVEYILLAVFDGVSSAIDSGNAVGLAKGFLQNNHSEYLGNTSVQLSSLVHELNSFLVGSGLEEPFMTCSLLFVPSCDRYCTQYINLGDSRIYAISPKFMQQITVDDSDRYHKNILLKYLGNSNLDDSDFAAKKYNGDATGFLVCSDGFYGVFETDFKLLLKLHLTVNMKHRYYLKENIRKLVCGNNNDDATYVLVRYKNV